MADSWIEESFEIVEQESMFLKLNEVYDRIPSGTCMGCGKCCNESVRTHYIEFLNIYKHMVENNLITSAFKKAVTNYYFTEFIQVHECPFRVDGACLIYPVRPLVCRLFGHVEKMEHEQGLEKIHSLNAEAAKYLKEEYDVDVPEAVIYKTIPHCEAFQSEIKIEEQDRIELSTTILMMDSEFFKNDLLEEYHLEYGLVQWFIDLWIDPDEADDLRIQISKELSLNGVSQTLDQLIENS